MIEPTTNEVLIDTKISTPKLRTPILSESVKDLHLKPNRPYPTEMMQAIRDAADTRQMIQAYRRAQEHVALKEVK